MKSAPFAAGFLLVSLLFPAAFAETASTPATKAETETPGDANQSITFSEYRNWRMAYMERRRSELTVQLATADLTPQRKSRLEQTKTYYDWLAGLPDGERDRRFRERFDRIDTNHDGQIDTTERAAWRDKQRAFYHRETGAHTQASNTH